MQIVEGIEQSGVEINSILKKFVFLDYIKTFVTRILEDV
jgi:hypothetical protein